MTFTIWLRNDFGRGGAVETRKGPMSAVIEVRDAQGRTVEPNRGNEMFQAIDVANEVNKTGSTTSVVTQK